jgi:hypothetical protein
MNCTLCGQPLSEAEVKLKVTAHFRCVVAASFGAAVADSEEEEP